MRIRNTLSEALYRLSEWLREWLERLADWMEDASEALYVPEVDAKQTGRGRARE